nr:integrase, catalytic region, zinc finger, CCHC-type, peptidase aspartic, catalytic [Tanacetum cinerariifolium]
MGFRNLSTTKITYVQPVKKGKARKLYFHQNWHNKTPYQLIRGRKPNIQYFHMFGSLCYPINDRDDLGKMKPKVNIVSIIEPKISKKLGLITVVECLVYMLMARLQPADDNAENVPSYDAKVISVINSSSKVHEQVSHVKRKTIIQTMNDDQIDFSIIFDDLFLENNGGTY